MPAAEHVQQLQFLMPAHKLVAGYEPDYKWSRKLKEAKGNKSRRNRSGGLYQSIQAEGIREPVHVFESPHFGDRMGNGQHRVAVAHDLDPTTEVRVIQHVRTNRYHQQYDDF